MDYYKLSFEKDDYVTAFQVVDTDISLDYNYCGVLPDDMILSIMSGGWYRLINNKLVVDQLRKDTIIAKKEEEAKKPTWEETIESQVYYTALLTDTLIEEEE